MYAHRRQRRLLRVAETPPAHKALAAQIEPKAYEYGFLKR